MDRGIEHSQRTVQDIAIQVQSEQLTAAIELITVEFIANEIGFPTYPRNLMGLIAERLTKPDMGWPTMAEATIFLQESFEWTDN